MRSGEAKRKTGRKPQTEQLTQQGRQSFYFSNERCLDSNNTTSRVTRVFLSCQQHEGPHGGHCPLCDKCTPPPPGSSLSPDPTVGVFPLLPSSLPSLLDTHLSIVLLLTETPHACFLALNSKSREAYRRDSKHSDGEDRPHTTQGPTGHFLCDSQGCSETRPLHGVRQYRVLSLARPPSKFPAGYRCRKMWRATGGGEPPCREAKAGAAHVDDKSQHLSCVLNTHERSLILDIHFQILSLILHTPLGLL